MSEAARRIAERYRELARAIESFLEGEVERIARGGERDLDRDRLRRLFEEHGSSTGEWDIGPDAPLPELLAQLRRVHEDLDDFYGQERLWESLQQMARGERGEFPEHWDMEW